MVGKSAVLTHLVVLSVHNLVLPAIQWWLRATNLEFLAGILGGLSDGDLWWARSVAELHFALPIAFLCPEVDLQRKALLWMPGMLLPCQVTDATPVFAPG